MVLAAMLLLLALAALLSGALSVKPSLKQTFAESIYDFCRSFTMSAAGKRGDVFLYFVGSLFLFILTANLMGQLPLKFISGLLESAGVLPHGKELIAATGDLNVAAGLGLATVTAYFFFGIQAKGLRFFKHYLSPMPLFLPLNLLEDLTRPGSLTIRLFFNIMIGEILSHIAMSVTPFVLPGAVICLELFVAVIQAYIFTTLSAVYISILSEDHH
jgi:F-type H+-transporting ATPase subunit a